MRIARSVRIDLRALGTSIARAQRLVLRAMKQEKGVTLREYAVKWSRIQIVASSSVVESYI